MPIQTQFPTAFRKSYLKRFLVDRFVHSISAPMPSVVSSRPGPGKLVKSVDSANNASIANKQLVIGDAVDNSDPAYYWTKVNDDGFTEENNLALILYPRHAAMVGWSKSKTISLANLAYGASGRDAYVSGQIWNQVGTNSVDDVWIIVFSDTEVQYFIRRGPIIKLAFTTSLQGNIELFPTILGQVGELESIYTYKVTPVEPLVNIPTPTEGMTFTHPLNQYLVEFDIPNISGSSSNSIYLYVQDSNNKLLIQCAPNGQPSLYKVEAGVSTLISRMGNTGDIVNNSRMVVQFKPDSIFGTSSGSGTSFKAWVNGSGRFSTGSMPFADVTSGIFGLQPATLPVRNFKIWDMNYE